MLLPKLYCIANNNVTYSLKCLLSKSLEKNSQHKPSENVTFTIHVDIYIYIYIIYIPIPSGHTIMS